MSHMILGSYQEQLESAEVLAVLMPLPPQGHLSPASIVELHV